MQLPPPDYSALLQAVKQRVREVQYRALRQVNQQQIQLYWDLGRLIAERQQQQGWGKSVVETLARDLQTEFVGMSGFSVQNLGTCGSSTRSTARVKSSNRWLEKSAGPSTCSP